MNKLVGSAFILMGMMLGGEALGIEICGRGKVSDLRFKSLAGCQKELPFELSLMMGAAQSDFDMRIRSYKKRFPNLKCDEPDGDFVPQQPKCGRGDDELSDAIYFGFRPQDAEYLMCATCRGGPGTKNNTEPQ